MLRIVHETSTSEAQGTDTTPLDLDELCRVAAREIWALALDAEWRAYLAAHAGALEATGNLRTSNLIESTFSTVRLRTRVTKGAGFRAAGLAMVFKLLEAAQ